MSTLLINQVPIEIINPTVDIFLSGNEIESFIKKNKKRLFEVVKSNSLRDKLSSIDSDNIYFSFESNEAAQQININLYEDRYFLKPFVNYCLKQYCLSNRLIVCDNFIQDLEIWEPQDKSDLDGCTKYRVFSIKIINDKAKRELSFLLSLGRERHIYNRNLNQLTPGDLLDNVNKVLLNKQVFRYKKNRERIDLERSFPVLSKYLRKGLNLSYQKDNKFRKVADYTRYFNTIKQFYEKHLKGQILNSRVKIFSSGFKEVENEHIFKLGYEKNYLHFGNDQINVNVYNGISRYGPYRTPNNVSNIRFIFIFHELDKNLANDLYKYLARGYKNFPGLSQYIGIPLNLDKDRSISFKDINNPIPEISDFISNKIFDESQRYIALYISPYNKFEENEEKRIIYYRLKELLLQNNISSQVILKENILNPNFNFSLPNIAIGLLAKAGGIPWKLKREKRNFLLIGFGAKKIRTGEEYVGNTICFDNEGVFQEFNTFTSNIDNIANNIENSIKTYLNNPLNVENSIRKLIIHYYKEFSGDEQDKLDEILSGLDLNIPYVVLTINDTKTKDFICFDPDYRGLMPISGTIVQLQKHREYLLFNNTRYNEYPTTKVDYSFPVKVKISAASHIAINSNEAIKELIDEVYQFSRMYWRSVKQKSNPVTVEYSKMIARMVADFKEHKLPDTDTAHKTLWFI